MAEPGFEPKSSVHVIIMLSWASLRHLLGSLLPETDAEHLENHNPHKLGLNHKGWFKNNTKAVTISLGGSVLSLRLLPLLWGVILFFQQSLI